MDVKKHRTRSIRHISDVEAFTRQFPDQPGIDGAAREFAALGSLARSGNMLQEPDDLGAGKISVRHQACLLLNDATEPLFADEVAHRGGPPALPDNGMAKRFARRSVPQYDGLTLVGNADGSDFCGGHFAVRPGREHLLCNVTLRFPDFFSIMLYPSRLRIILFEFAARGCGDVSLGVKQHRARTRRPLVECEYVSGLAHRVLVSRLPNFALPQLLISAKQRRLESPGL